MTERERFEKWANKRVNMELIERSRTVQGYTNQWLYDAWEAWQAASVAPAHNGGAQNTRNTAATRANAGSAVARGLLVESAAPAQEPDYEAMEREHFGDADKRTGIYAAPVASAAPVVPEDRNAEEI